MSLETHSYLVDKYASIIAPPEHFNTPSPAATTLEEEAGKEFISTSSAGTGKEKSAIDFDFQTSQEMGKQLITGYAQLLASSFLTLERVSGGISLF